MLLETLRIIAAAVNEDIIHPPAGISNISEWCKREGCWNSLVEKADDIGEKVPDEFWDGLTSTAESVYEAKTARQNQKIEDGIEVQKQVFDIPPAKWSEILRKAASRNLLTPKEVSIIRIAEQMPAKIPTERQSAVLVQILAKVRQEGLL